MKISVKQKHELTIGEARDRLTGFVFALKRRFDMERIPATEVWSDTVLTYAFKGPLGNSFKGTVSIFEDTVEVIVDSLVLNRVVTRVLATNRIAAALREALDE